MLVNYEPKRITYLLLPPESIFMNSGIYKHKLDDIFFIETLHVILSWFV
jgi:hypothetical protein